MCADVFFFPHAHRKMRIWKHQEDNNNLPSDWKAQRDQYWRYIQQNAIYKTLVQRKGDKALDLIGFSPSFWGDRNRIDAKKKVEEKGPSAIDTVKTLRAEIDRLEEMLLSQEK